MLRGMWRLRGLFHKPAREAQERVSARRVKRHPHCSLSCWQSSGLLWELSGLVNYMITSLMPAGERLEDSNCTYGIEDLVHAASHDYGCKACQILHTRKPFGLHHAESYFRIIASDKSVYSRQCTCAALATTWEL